jgi:hypothetical protein
MRDYSRMSADSSISEADRRWLKVLGTLNEFQARLFVAERALQLGRGGISKVSQLTGMSRPAIYRGLDQLQGKPLEQQSVGNRIRRTGGGRKRAEAVDPKIRRLLRGIVEETTAGDPMSLLKWTSKSTRLMADQLTRQGHAVSAMTVSRYLRQMGYSLQGNVKSLEGPQHRDRDAQFRYINRQVRSFGRNGDPVISVDTKKKELVGAFRNPGQRWQPAGEAEPVLVHDFPHLGQGKAIPYGTYDISEDRALVNVGITHDTAEFAVASIRRWWQMLGRKSYPQASRLLICADAGGSNGNRSRSWKLHLQQLANSIGATISVCHYPPGTSKWNKIEHRLFSFISMNWRGRPLVSYQAVVNLIGSTRTRSGLQVKALLDTGTYETGKKVSVQQMEQLSLRRHSFHPDWNYTLSVQKNAT